MWVCRRRRAWIRQNVLSRICGITVGLMLTFFTATAFSFPAADYSTIAIANPCSHTANDVAILIPPTPYSAFRSQ